MHPFNYYYQGEAWIFKGLTVPKLGEWQQIIDDMHDKLGRFSEQHTLVEIWRRYYWHIRT
jgi:hypothetical protein